MDDADGANGLTTDGTNAAGDGRPLYSLLTAAGISQVGNAMTIVAGPWFVLQTTGSRTSAEVEHTNRRKIACKQGFRRFRRVPSVCLQAGATRRPG